MAYLVLGREIGANSGISVFALLCGAAIMLTFASLHAAKPQPPVRANEVPSYEFNEGKDKNAQSWLRCAR